MPSMMTTCAAHQVRPEAHAVVLCLLAAFIEFPTAFGRELHFTACFQNSLLKLANVLRMSLSMSMGMRTLI